MQSEPEQIRGFIARVGGPYPSSDTDINQIAEAFLSVQHLFDRLNFYATEAFLYRTEGHSLQYDLRGALHYRVAQLLKSDSPSVVSVLDAILDGIPAILLIGYPFDEVISAHNGYFLPRLEAELKAVLQNKIKNRERMGLNSYIKYPSAKELLKLCPELALRVLPLVFAYNWNAGYRMDFADALYDFGNRSDGVERYRDLRYNHFGDAFFRSPECFKYVKEVIEYHVACRGAAALSEEAERLEELLASLALKFPGSLFDQYFNNKWHGDNWRKRTIVLENGWRFYIDRSPYIEQTRVCVDGGEYAKGQYAASYPEQVEWLHKTLANNSLGHYSSSWEVDFTIWGNSLLKHLLAEIEKLGCVVEDKVTSPV